LTGARLLARAVRAALTLAWVFVVCFALLHAMPGDPLDRLDAAQVPAAQAERTRRALGLDRPVFVQLARTLLSYATGDLGISFSRGRPVASVLAAAVPPTVVLGTAALILGYGVGIPISLGLIALGRRRRRAFDSALLVLASIPRFWLGALLILTFHSFAGWFPASHTTAPGGGDWIDRLRHLVLPALTLGLPAACVVARFQLVAMERALASAHVRAARATGSGGLRLAARHLLRPSLGPAVSLLGLDLPVLVSGAIVVEVTFSWPGLGRTTADAVLSSDYPLALAAAMLSAGAVFVGRMSTEWLATAIDPRQRTGDAEAAT